MKKSLPSENIRACRDLIGTKIVAVRRQLFIGDFDLPDFEQNADGPVELTFDNGAVLTMFADTERLSLTVEFNRMPKLGEGYIPVDVSQNAFWRDRLNAPVLDLIIIQSANPSEQYPCEFAVQFSLQGGLNVAVEYLNEEELPDMVRVVEQCSDSSRYVLHALRSISDQSAAQSDRVL